jgi:hypothetical protein
MGCLFVVAPLRTAVRNSFRTFLKREPAAAPVPFLHAAVEVGRSQNVVPRIARPERLIMVRATFGVTGSVGKALSDASLTPPTDVGIIKLELL